MNFCSNKGCPLDFQILFWFKPGIILILLFSFKKSTMYKYFHCVTLCENGEFFKSFNSLIDSKAVLRQHHTF